MKKGKKVEVAVQVAKRPFPRSLVVAHPNHMFDMPVTVPIRGNIMDFMKAIGGGAVLVRFKWRPSNPLRISFTIERIDNGPQVQRMTGFEIEDYSTDTGLISVSGTFSR